MRKTKFLVSTMLVASLFTACKKDNPATTEEGGADNSFVALGIDFPKSRGIAGSGSNTDPGTQDENQIKTVRAIFFDETGVSANDGTDDGSRKVVKVVQWTVSGGPTSAVHTISVPDNAKNVLIIANPPAALAAPAKDTEYNTVLAAIENITTADASSTSNGFLMSNASGKLGSAQGTGTGADFQLKNLEPKSTKADAMANPVTIKIDRVVAKVTAKAPAGNNDSAGDIDVNFDPASAKYLLTVTNKKMFIMSERVKSEITETPSIISANPNDQYQLGSWRKDPNYSGQHAQYGDGMEGNGLNNETDYLKEYDIIKEDSEELTWKSAVNGSAEAAYCLENTQEGTDNYQAFVTSVQFKAQVYPKRLTGASGGEEDGSAKSWFSFPNTPKSHYDLEGIKKAVKDAYDKSTSDSGKEKGEWIERVNAFSDSPVLTGSELTSDNSISDAIDGLFNTTLTAGKAVVGQGGKYCFYKDAWNYYLIPVNHDYASTGDDLKTAAFGVTRNTSYTVNINKISNPGEPGPVVPDPDKPVIPDNKFLTVKVEVNPWVIYQQDVEL